MLFRSHVRDETLEATWSWSALISDVANKTGAHTDDERPISWDRVGAFEIGGVPVIPRLLYRFAVLVVEAGNAVLSEIGERTVDAGDLIPSLGGGIIHQAYVVDNRPD